MSIFKSILVFTRCAQYEVPVLTELGDNCTLHIERPICYQMIIKGSVFSYLLGATSEDEELCIWHSPVRSRPLALQEK